MKKLFVEVKNERKTSRHLGGNEFIDVFFYRLTEGGESSPHAAFRFHFNSSGSVKVGRMEQSGQG